ncbi:MAG: hypothetical protein JSW47_18690 [Phycisphaerales bacterium]|nr:MAG: hypothetical protein JSW47_18690 [Phycisphaerales bacterium]UCF15919.1 MAG: hypothetical protein JSW59_00375 [Phycisphaerales bacterium]
MHYLQEVKKWLGEITEVFLLLIALGVVAEILFANPETTGSGIPFLGRIVPNLTGLVDTLGQQGLVGLIALAVIIYLFQRRGVFSQQHQ